MHYRQVDFHAYAASVECAWIFSAMPKRKRDFLAAKAAQNSSDNPKDKDRQIITLIERSQKDLVRALKLAKGFERQKLSRRLRNATSDGATEEVTRIEAEIRAWRVCSYPG